MKITFIKPNIGRHDHSLFVDEARMEPHQLGVLAGLTPPEHEIALYDDRLERIPFDEPTDLVALTIETYTARRSYEISEEYRKRGVPVVMGGMHATLNPDEVAEHADSVFMGDAEFGWHLVLEDAAKGALKPLYEYQGGEPQPYSQTRRDIFKGKGYLPISLMQFSRGCIYDCHYCATSAFFKKTHFMRDINNVVQEIKDQNLKTIFFVDDNIVANHEKAKELFRALIPLKIKWMSQASIDQTQDLELMDLMVKSGCLGNVIGFESIDIDSLKEMNKGPNIADFNMYEDEIKILNDYGLQTWAAFTFGHDADTVDTIEKTVAFSLKNKFTFAAYNILMPYPGTPLFDKLKKENRLLFDDKWWLHPEYRFNHASIIPNKMTPDELTEACFAARKKFNSIPSLIKRFFARKTNMKNLVSMFYYFTYARLFRKETFKKQDMLFGFTDKKADELGKFEPIVAKEGV
ncbi:MAG: B12-binding domain-containing radical SAM protein [bacterium]|nr:B12-binding domain-containing radical SAM protein [bacterium]